MNKQQTGLPPGHSSHDSLPQSHSKTPRWFGFDVIRILPVLAVSLGRLQV